VAPPDLARPHPGANSLPDAPVPPVAVAPSPATAPSTVDGWLLQPWIDAITPEGWNPRTAAWALDLGAGA
jgi:hypothetical protein